MRVRGLFFLDEVRMSFDTVIGLLCILVIAFVVVGAIGKLLFGDS